MIDPRTGAVTPVIGPDGKPLMGKAAAEKPLNETQSNALGFGMRAKESDGLIAELEKTAGFDPASGTQRAASSVPGVGNYFTPPAHQKYNQAKRNFISAVLRKESGAAIQPSEFDMEDKKYFPQPGDGKDVLKQKADARKTAIFVLQTQAGREFTNVPKPGGGNRKFKVGAKEFSIPANEVGAFKLDNPTAQEL